MSITAIVENGAIKLPMHVPDGTQVEITLPTASGAEQDGLTLYDTLKEIIGKADGLPPDFAAERRANKPLCSGSPPPLEGVRAVGAGAGPRYSDDGPTHRNPARFA